MYNTANPFILGKLEEVGVCRWVVGMNKGYLLAKNELSSFTSNHVSKNQKELGFRHGDRLSALHYLLLTIMVSCVKLQKYYEEEEEDEEEEEEEEEEEVEEEVFLEV